MLNSYGVSRFFSNWNSLIWPRNLCRFSVYIWLTSLLLIRQLLVATNMWVPHIAFYTYISIMIIVLVHRYCSWVGVFNCFSRLNSFHIIFWYHEGWTSGKMLSEQIKHKSSEYSILSIFRYRDQLSSPVMQPSAMSIICIILEVTWKHVMTTETRSGVYKGTIHRVGAWGFWLQKEITGYKVYKVGNEKNTAGTQGLEQGRNREVNTIEERWTRAS